MPGPKPLSLALFAICALFFGASGCSSMLFFPSRLLYVDPAKEGFDFEEVRFPSYDGTSLYGWYFKHPKSAGPAKGVILYAHGNGGNISSQFGNISYVLDHGYDYLAFDYRGYGSSGGNRPDPREAVGDTIAALRWADARAKAEHLPLFAFGQSLGTALLVRALVEEKATIHPKLIVLDSPFLSYEWGAASVLSQHGLTTPFQPFVFFLVSDEWAPGRRIRELAPTPILIFHGDRDRVIDYRLGLETYAAAGEPKEFVGVPGAGHIQSLWVKDREKYRTLLFARMDAAAKSE
ncbi:MAG: alpha/beta hydrolase [Bdellovibrionales bacterium]|nr:alpha/beta hydrolase [Bdellovibrionales bacterium]